MHSINTVRLSEMIRSKRGNRGLRETAQEIGSVSVSTLSRVENGNLPDIDTYVKICNWLQVSIDFFTREEEDNGESKLEIVVSNLRADKTLKPEVSAALITMINMAYASV